MRDVRCLSVPVMLADSCAGLSVLPPTGHRGGRRGAHRGRRGRARPARQMAQEVCSQVRTELAPPNPTNSTLSTSRRKADGSPHHDSSVSPRLSAPGAIDRSSDRENDRLIKQVARSQLQGFRPLTPHRHTACLRRSQGAAGSSANGTLVGRSRAL